MLWRLSIGAIKFSEAQGIAKSLFEPRKLLWDML
jgi:hypothetical protein